MRSTWGGSGHQLRIHVVVAVAIVALLCAGVSNLIVVPPRSVAVDVMPVAAITESPTTVGMADSALYFMSDAEIARTLDELQALGVQNIRIQVPWAGVQPIGPNTYVWERIDRTVEAAVARNMGILGVLNHTPGWAGTPELSGQPYSPQAYANFTAAVAQRYAGRISAYEVWNEPNSIASLNPVDPAGYTALLKAAYPAIKAADPSATVIAGVVGSVLPLPPLLMSPVTFIDGMYAAGAHGYFDALSFHPYQYTLKFSEGQSMIGSPIRQLEQIRDLMRLNGDGALKVWATEYGLPTPPTSEEQQADFIADFLQSWQTVEGTGPIFIYTTRDFATGSTNDQDNFGVFYQNWDPKLAAGVIAAFIAAQQPPPQHPIIEAIRAAVREIARITGEVVELAVDAIRAVATAFVDVVTFVAKATAAAIRGAVSLGVQIVKTVVGMVQTAVDRVVAAVADCLDGHQPAVAGAGAVTDAPVAQQLARTAESASEPVTARPAVSGDVDPSSDVAEERRAPAPVVADESEESAEPIDAEPTKPDAEPVDANPDTEPADTEPTKPEAEPTEAEQTKPDTTEAGVENGTETGESAQSSTTADRDTSPKRDDSGTNGDSDDGGSSADGQA